MEGDFKSFFIDEDRSNCKAENLRWYGKEYLVGEAIKMAEESDHPLAHEFKLFWLGDHQALNGWFEEQKIWVKPYMHKRLDMFCVPYYVDVDNCVQEVVLRMFLALRRGMIRKLEHLKAWARRIARNVLAEAIKNLTPSIPIDQENSEGDFYSLADLTRWCHPSAELQAIYRQEFKQ